MENNPPNANPSDATPPLECVMCAAENPKSVLKFEKHCLCPLVVCVSCGPNFVRHFNKCSLCNLYEIDSFTFPANSSDERFFIRVCNGKQRSNWRETQLEEKKIRNVIEFYIAKKQKNANLFGFSQPTFDALLNQEEKKQGPPAEYLEYFQKIRPDSERVKNAKHIDLNKPKQKLEIFSFQPPKKERNIRRNWLSFFIKQNP